MNTSSLQFFFVPRILGQFQLFFTYNILSCFKSRAYRLQAKACLSSLNFEPERIQKPQMTRDDRKWRTRKRPIRTASLIPARVKVPVEQTRAVYQKLAPKIKEMKALGMSYRDIAVSLGIDKKTVGKALAYSDV